MHRRNFIIWLTIFTLGSVLTISCSLKWLGRAVWQPPSVVAVEGAEGYIVYPLHFSFFLGPLQEGHPTHLPLRDGDLVAVDDNKWFFYRNSDGRYLTIAGDEIQTLLNGKTVSLTLDKEAAWQWLEKATSEELDALRFLHIANEIDEKQLALLKRRSEPNANLDVLIVEKAKWRQVLALFDPEWLWLEVGALEAEDRAMLAAEKRLRSLSLSIDADADISFLSQMPGYETLWINGWEPEKTGPLPKNLRNLKRLYLQSMKAKDLTPLAAQPNLEELNLAASAVDDLSRLAYFPGIKVLNLAGCENLRDLAPLKQLKQLKWLELPPTTTQQQLVEIVHDHPGLVGLELFGVKNITDLTPLKGLRHLEFLLVSAPNAAPDPLFDMKTLKWLAIQTEKKDEKKEKVAPQDEDLAVRLRKALPATAVVRVEPFCLGSGWILLLVPAVGLAWLAEKRRNRKGCAAGAKDARI